MFDCRDEEGPKQTKFLYSLAAHHSAISSNTHGATSTTMVELPHVSRHRRVHLPAALPARALFCHRARPCAACSHRTAPLPSSPVHCLLALRRAVSEFARVPRCVVTVLALASRRRRARPCAACSHRATPSPSSPARPPARTAPRHRRVRPPAASPARALCRHQARLLACEICEAERAQEQRREYMTSKWDELVQPIF
jgi:hypothetical protein